MGRGVTCYLAPCYPQEVKGIHLTDVVFAGDLVSAPDGDLAPDELAYKRKATDNGLFVERFACWNGGLDRGEVSRLERLPLFPGMFFLYPGAGWSKISL